MDNKSRVSTAVIRRLPRYYRYLGDLLKNDITRISSKELSVRMGLTASQIRQDFNCFGGYGQQGYGYNVEVLHNEIAGILGIFNQKKAILIGAGNLGQALINHIEFKNRGFVLCGIFDVNENIVGKEINGLKVRHMEEIDAFIKKEKPIIAIITVPKSETKAIVKLLADRGIKGFWNFSNIDIHIPGTVFENVHLSDSLMTLCYRMSNVK